MHTVCGVRVCKINRSRGQKRNNTARDWIEVVTSRTIVYRGTVLLCFYLVIVAYLINQNRSHSRFCPCPNGIIRKFIQSNNWLNICVRVWVCVYAVLETNWKYRWWARTKKNSHWHYGIMPNEATVLIEPQTKQFDREDEHTHAE